MVQILKCLWCIVVSFMIGGKVSAYSLVDRHNSSEEYGYYNIYNKIDSLQKAFQTLETNGQRKNNMLRQVLKSITEIDEHIEMSDERSQGPMVIQTIEKNDTAVGFTTKISGSYSSTSSIIRGSTILYNGGNAYNGTVFTCPSPGLYLLHVTLFTGTQSGGIYIYKNTNRLVLAYGGSGHPQSNGASVSATLLLDVGDQVYLRPSGSTLSVDGESVFMGVKVN